MALFSLHQEDVPSCASLCQGCVPQHRAVVVPGGGGSGRCLRCCWVPCGCEHGRAASCVGQAGAALRVAGAGGRCEVLSVTMNVAQVLAAPGQQELRGPVRPGCDGHAMGACVAG